MRSTASSCTRPRVDGRALDVVQLRRPHPDEAPTIHRLLEEASRTEPEGRFIVDPLDVVARHLDGPDGFTVVAGDGDLVVAAMIVRFPRDAEDNLARGLGYDDATVLAAAHIESVAVAPPYRGRGLQRALLSSVEEELVRDHVPVALATVSPDNEPSRRNFLKAGYVDLARRKMYGGVDRIIIGKQLS
ncbi:GNAT family N-acetyltransferase [Microbacterium hominis]|uniref:GNAT family N-acetyltransferase n=1 Tax=Microbacterium hominis TaxID=162426 RepID=UPI0030B87823